MKKIIITVLILFVSASCSHIEREAKVDTLISNPMPDPHVIHTDADPKSISVHVTSSVKDTEKETELLKCLTISELQKAGWKAQATADDCKRCEEVVHSYGTYERIEKFYGPFSCQSFNQLSFLNLDFEIKSIKKTNDSAIVFLGPLFTGRAKVTGEISISANSTSQNILIIKASINAESPNCTFGFFDKINCALIGSTNQATNEAAAQIAKMFRAIKR